MADELQTKRIIDLAQKTGPEAGDNLAVDNATSGTRRILWENLLDGNLADDNKAAPAGAAGRAIEDTRTTFTDMVDGIKEELNVIHDSGDYYSFAKYGGWAFPPSTVVETNKRAYINDFPLKRNSGFTIHYPETIKIYVIDEKINGTWYSKSIPQDDVYIPSTGIEQAIIIFSNKTDINTDITPEELEKIYVEVKSAESFDIEELQNKVEEIDEMNTIVANATVVYGAYTVYSDGKSFDEIYNTIRAKTNICYTNKCGFKFLVELPSTLRIQAYHKCVNGIWTQAGVDTPYGGIFTVDPLASAIRMTFRNKDDSSAEITEEELKNISVTFLHDEYFEKVIPDSPTWYYGKKYAALGDSVTYGFIPRNYTGYPGQLDSYAKLSAQKLGMEFVNYGISGNTLAAVGDITNPMSVRYTQLPDDADLITVMGGTNDIRLGVPTGQMSDRTNTTFYGALHVLLSGLYKKYYIDQGTTVGKAKKIVVCTPIKLLLSSASTQGGTGTLRDMTAYCNAIKEVAAYYSFPVIDLYNLSGINPHLNETIQGTEEGYTGFYNPYITDGTHPTQEGQQIMANVLCGFLKTLV